MASNPSTDTQVSPHNPPTLPPSKLTCPKTSYTKATRAELAQEYDEAFRLYIKAAEGFIHLSRGSADDADKVRWKKEAGKALERAERIKCVKGQSGLRGVEVNFWSDGTQMP
jgi:calpain-7